MRYVRFRDPAGATRTGRWTDAGIEFGDDRYDPEEVDVLPPTDPSKIVAVGLNYRDHAEEMGHDLPEVPSLFLMAPNALAGHGDEIRLRSGDARVDHEAELGVVIGQQCRDVPAGDAMEYVKGFTCVNDVSNRDRQFDDRLGRPDMVRGKAFDGGAPAGPVVATPDEVPADASIRLRVNGEPRQESSRGELIFGVPELVAEISAHLTLERGDLITTGTTSGVGPLSDGDEVEVEVEGVGTLEHAVRID